MRHDHTAKASDQADPWALIKTITRDDWTYARKVAAKDFELEGWPEDQGIGSSDISGRVVSLIERGDLEVEDGRAVFAIDCEAAQCIASPRRNFSDESCATLEEALRDGGRFDFRFTGSRTDAVLLANTIRTRLWCTEPERAPYEISTQQLIEAIHQRAPFPPAPPAAVAAAVAALRDHLISQHEEISP